MNDPVYLDVSLQIEANLRQVDKNETRILCENLLRFCYEKGLLQINPFTGDGSFNINTVVKWSNLTEEGQAYFYDLSEKWLIYTDRTNNIHNIKMLEKWYSKMNPSSK